MLTVNLTHCFDSLLNIYNSLGGSKVLFVHSICNDEHIFIFFTTLKVQVLGHRHALQRQLETSNAYKVIMLLTHPYTMDFHKVIWPKVDSNSTKEIFINTTCNGHYKMWLDHVSLQQQRSAHSNSPYWWAVTNTKEKMEAVFLIQVELCIKPLVMVFLLQLITQAQLSQPTMNSPAYKVDDEELSGQCWYTLKRDGGLAWSSHILVVY